MLLDTVHMGRSSILAEFLILLLDGLLITIFVRLRVKPIYFTTIHLYQKELRTCDVLKQPKLSIVKTVPLLL